MHKRLWVYLMLLLLVIVPGVLAQDDQPARQLTFGQPASGVIDSAHPAQVYSFAATMEPAAGYQLSLANTGAVPLQVTLTDAAGALIQQFAEVAPSTGTGTNILPISVTGIYYVNIAPAAPLENASGSFDLIVTEQTSGGRLVPEVQLAQGMTVTLEWDLPARLSLEVRDPLGGELHWRTPNPSAYNAAISAIAAPLDCATALATPKSQTAHWESGLIPIGSYEILVHFFDACVTNRAIPFSVTVSVDGVQLPIYTAELLSTDTYIAGFVIAEDGSAVTTGRSGFVPNQLRLSMPITTAELFASAQPILANARLTAWLGNDQPYLAYVFMGQAGERMTMRLYRMSGSLDAYLALLDSNGNILAINDDYLENGTDAALENVRLPQTGRYLILATRYGEFAGATEGDFDLSVNSAGELTAALSGDARDLNSRVDDSADLLIYNGWKSVLAESLTESRNP